MKCREKRDTTRYISFISENRLPLGECSLEVGLIYVRAQLHNCTLQYVLGKIMHRFPAFRSLLNYFILFLHSHANKWQIKVVNQAVVKHVCLPYILLALKKIFNQFHSFDQNILISVLCDELCMPRRGGQINQFESNSILQIRVDNPNKNTVDKGR